MIPICEEQRCCLGLCLEESALLGFGLSQALERTSQGRGRMYEERPADSIIVV